MLEPEPIRIQNTGRREYEKPPELVFLNLYGAQESMPRHQFRQPIYSLAGRYDNPIPTRCLAPINFLKIPAQDSNSEVRDFSYTVLHLTPPLIGHL